MGVPSGEKNLPLNMDGSLHDCRPKPDEIIEQDVKQAEQKPIITPPAPPPEKPKSSEEAGKEYNEPRFTSADELPVVKGKVVEINLSRTVSYKYGVAAEYATEKEEILNSLTYGVKVECDVDSLPVLEKLQTQTGNHINAVLWEDFLKKRKLRMIKGEE